MIDAPGLAIIREGGELSYTWAPATCPAEIFDGQLRLWGLQVLEEYELPSGLRSGTLVSGMEGYAADQEGTAYSASTGA